MLQPTRLRSKTLIDNIFFNSLNFHSSSGNLLVEISDHLIQYLVLDDFIKGNKRPPSTRYKREIFVILILVNLMRKLSAKSAGMKLLILIFMILTSHVKTFMILLNFFLTNMYPIENSQIKNLNCWINHGSQKKFSKNVMIEIFC